jgi:hypothetical protein
VVVQGQLGKRRSRRSRVADAAEELLDARPLDVLARFGFAVMALVHLLIGAIALGVAAGGDGEVEPTGALEELVATDAGPYAMWAGFAGCLGLALWQFSEATLRPRRLPVAQRLSRAVSSGSLSIAYGSMAATFARFATGEEIDSSERTRDFTLSLMRSAYGIPVVVGLGLTVLGVGVYFIIKGVRRGFRDELRHFEDQRRGKVIDGLGVLGYVAKGAALVLVGALFVVAAVEHEPEQATGLDGSLKALQDHPFGELMLVLIAVGLISYGIFAMIRSQYGRM